MSGGKQEGVDALVNYLTGPCVAIHSMGLSLSGMPRVAAERFYAMRAALGVDGYATPDEARAAISRALGETPNPSTDGEA